MKKLALTAACAALAGLSLTACTGSGGGGGVYAAGDVGPGPYAYDGFYDDFYGPVYDGYWGDDDAFYYRASAGDREFRRGDPQHFHRGGDAPGANFHSMQGTMNPSPGLNMPHFAGGGRHR